MNHFQRVLRVGCVFALAVGLCSAIALAQPVLPGEAPPPSTEEATDDVYPRLKLTYYLGPEGGGWKEVQFFDFTEWTIEKDVYLDYGWTDPPKNSERPLKENGERDYSLAPPQRRVWRIRYEPAATEGQSRLFISGIGGRNGRVRIYGDTDVVSLIYIIDTGWHELGPEARLARYLQQRRQNAVSPSPIPTRSQ